ncbi:hypothetical protein BaRGS_00009161, partial [Batillaria attramentaria]
GVALETTETVTGNLSEKQMSVGVSFSLASLVKRHDKTPACYCEVFTSAYESLKFSRRGHACPCCSVETYSPCPFD